MAPGPFDRSVRTISQIRQEHSNEREAAIRDADQRGRRVLRYSVDLTSAHTPGTAQVIDWPFDSFYVESATDNTTNAQLVLSSLEAQNSQNYLSLVQNAAARMDQPAKQAFLLNPAQPGKSMVIVFLLGVQYYPGSLLQQIAGAVNVLTGTGQTTLGDVAVTATATQLLAADSSRKRATLSVLNGGTVYLGGTNAVVGAAGVAAGGLTGIPLPVGSSYEITHQGPVWAVTDSGTSLVAINTEV